MRLNKEEIITAASRNSGAFKAGATGGGGGITSSIGG
jgi:hypothetical protein